MPYVLCCGREQDTRFCCECGRKLVVPAGDALLTEAYRFVESMAGRADAHAGPYPLWHGWALREAFLAGARAALPAGKGET